MVNVRGKVVGERQHLSQLYERRVVRKARVIEDDNSMSLLNIISFSRLVIIIIIMYIYHALINDLSAHMIQINLNTIF